MDFVREKEGFGKGKRARRRGRKGSLRGK